MKKELSGKWISRLCYGVLIFFMLTILLRIFTRVIIVKNLQVENNFFVNALFFDRKELTRPGDEEAPASEEETLSIDWAQLYPFPYEESKDTFSEKILKWQNKIEALEAKANSVTEKVSVYATNHLIGQTYFTGTMNQLKTLIGWNLTSYHNYNDVVTLKDGRLTEYLPQRDITEHAQATKELKEFCDSLGCDFLYVQAPYAICKYENSKESSALDFSNQNADALLKELKDSNIECLDMREYLHEDKMSHANAFYQTDHHWKAETGLWAAGKLAAYLNESHGFSIDTAMLSKEQFQFITYPQWWLGSKGKKLTIKAVEPEDFTMIYPKYETLLHYQIPNRAIDKTGDFSITYDMEYAVTQGGYSEKNGYSVYNHGDNPFEILKNKKSGGKRILVIKDSFARVVFPFLACADGIDEIYMLDIRHFTGSAKTFIKEKNPDMVIIWYNPGSITEIDLETHTSTFDFR